MKKPRGIVREYIEARGGVDSLRDAEKDALAALLGEALSRGDWYIYYHISGGVGIHGPKGSNLDKYAKTNAEAIKFLEAAKKDGHDIPPSVVPRLKKDMRQGKLDTLVEFSANDYRRLRDSVARSIKIPLQVMMASADRLKEGKLKTSDVQRIYKSQLKELHSALRDLSNLDRV